MKLSTAGLLYNCLIILTLLSPLRIFSQTSGDSTDKFYELKEVVVSARNATALPDGLSIVPTSRERNTATSGFALLERMQVPILVIDPVNMKINLNTGEKVDYFINGVPSTLDEVKAIRPIEVKRVEVLRHPIDPRFEGSTAVINFIVKHISYGGYVSAEANQTFFYNEGDYALYSKYSTDVWTFQLIGGMNYLNTSGDSITQKAKYSFQDTKPIEMSESSKETTRKQRQYYGAVQGVRNYANGNVLTLKAGIRRFDNPELSRVGTTDYNGDKVNSLRINKMQRNVPFVNTSYLWNITPSAQLNVKAGFSAMAYKTNSLYKSPNDFIDNRIHEDVYLPQFSMYFMKDFNDKSQLSVSFDGQIARYITDYSGYMSSRQNLLTQDYKISAEWRYSFNNGWMMQLMGGMPVTLLKINHDRTANDVYPQFSVFASGRIKRIHSVSLYLSGTRNPRILTSLNDVDRVDTEFEGTAGNSSLKTTPVYDASASYTWLHSNKFQFGFAAIYQHRSNDCVYDYFYHDGVIFNRLVNSGNFDKLELRVSSSIKLFSNRLSLAPQVSIQKVRHTGIYNVDFWQPYASLSATFMPSDSFYMMLNASTPGGKVYYDSRGGYSKIHNALVSLRAGYIYRNVSASIAVYPLYKYSHDTDFMQSNVVDIHGASWRKAGQHRIKISFKYTFGFGKKVSKGKLYIENMSTTSVR